MRNENGGMYRMEIIDGIGCRWDGMDEINSNHLFQLSYSLVRQKIEISKWRTESLLFLVCD